ncbi:MULTISPECIES: hypothetical protein [unclassified Vibrio]|uniref:hypothetical protein n=1 Tax=unclassified Vibrio TaxID=2614977 RepID=UPI000B8E88E0|nr:MULTISPECIES: hypothetical protein [unclassified Vibrio]NAW97709.1 hypothetical protein [Vibrio sp. V23_P3S9T160]OXX42527.1 hypothetical protein B9J85_12315 [Vibrio sp. V11_P1A41T118]
MNLCKRITHSPFGYALACSLLLSGCIAYNSKPKNPRSYPLLSEAIYSEDDLSLADNPNIIRTAIEENQSVTINDLNALTSQLPIVFPELNLHLEQEHSFDARLFQSAVQQLVAQFACELYSSQQMSDSVQMCANDGRVTPNNLGYLPFQQGKYSGERLTVHRHSQPQGSQSQSVAVDLYLKSTSERPLSSIWGSTHTLGRFHGSHFSSDSVVLTVYFEGHVLDERHQWQAQYPEPLIFFLLLPSITTLLQQGNDASAAQFAMNNTRLLLVDSETRR